MKRTTGWGGGAVSDEVSAHVRKGVLIGYGTIAAGHIEGYRRMTRMRIGAVVDTSSERRASARHLLPGTPVFETIDEALESLPVDFVDVCTPPNSHLDYITTAVEHGLPVLCEKPLLTGINEIEALLRLGEGLSLVFPCHNYLKAPGILAMRREISALDEPVKRATFTTERIGHARGVRDWQPDWRRMPEIGGGGILLDHGPHSIYIACAVVGEYPSSVSCELEYPAGRWGATEDVASLVLHFGGGDVCIDLSWRANARSTSYEVVTETRTIELDGSGLTSAGNGQRTRKFIDSEFDDPQHGSWFQPTFSEIAASLDQGQPSACLNDAIVVMRAIHAAYSSAANSGAQVEIDALVDKSQTICGGNTKSGGCLG